MKKKFLNLGVISLLIIILFSLTGCEKKKEDIKEENDEEKSLYSVITTLDETYEGAEIMELQEPISMYFTVYPKKYRDEISVIKFKEKYGLISNTTGKVVIEPKYDFFDNCLDNMDDDYIYGYIGEKHYKIDFDDYTVTEVSISGHGGGSEFYYNPEKDEIYTEVYEYDPYLGSFDQSNTIKDFKELGTTLAPCSIDNEKYGFFDVTNGKIVIEPTYDSATLLADGYSAVSKDGKYFFINEKNEKVIDSEFEEAQNIHNENAWVKINGKWTLVKFNKLKKDEVKEVSNTSDNDVQWKKIYKEYILNNNLQEFNVMYYEPSISFLDLNTDGVPELIYQDGMEGGPRANKPYLIFGIKNNNVEEVYELWSGPYIKVGYNKDTDDYAYEAVHKGVSYDTAIVEISTKNGFEEKSNSIESGTAYELSDYGYKTNEFTMPETKFLNSFSEEEKEKAINEAFKNYKPTEELIN